MGGVCFAKKLKTAFFLFAMLFVSCGLDTFYYLEPPKTDGHTTKYTSTDRPQLYFSFLTNEEGDNSDYGSIFLFLELKSITRFIITILQWSARKVRLTH